MGYWLPLQKNSVSYNITYITFLPCLAQRSRNGVGVRKGSALGVYFLILVWYHLWVTCNFLPESYFCIWSLGPCRTFIDVEDHWDTRRGCEVTGSTSHLQNRTDFSPPQAPGCLRGCSHTLLNFMTHPGLIWPRKWKDLVEKKKDRDINCSGLLSQWNLVWEKIFIMHVKD